MLLQTQRSLKMAIRLAMMATVITFVSGCDSVKQSLFDTMLNMGYMAASMDKKSVQVDGHELVYIERDASEIPAGKTKPLPIILVHGFGVEKAGWVKMVMEIPERYPVIAIDVPAFGESSYLPDASYALFKQAERINAFLNKLNISKAHFVGNSMGGGIITELALQNPEKIASLTLMDSVGVDDPNTQSDFEVRMSEGDNAFVVKTKEDYESLIAFATQEMPFTPWPMMDVYAQQAIDRNPRNERLFKELVESYRDYQALLKNITVPVLVMWGENDRFLHVSNANIFTSNLPNAKLVIYENVGHAPLVEVPEQSAKDLVEFVDAI